MAFAIQISEGKGKKEKRIIVMMCLKDSSGIIKAMVHKQMSLGEGAQKRKLLNGVPFCGIIFKAKLPIAYKNVWLLLSDIIYTSSLRKSRSSGHLKWTKKAILHSHVTRKIFFFFFNLTFTTFSSFFFNFGQRILLFLFFCLHFPFTKCAVVPLFLPSEGWDILWDSENKQCL